MLVFADAGWHTSPALELPENITPVCLPPYAPELNPTKNIWEYLRKNYLVAMPGRLASITRRN